MKLLQSTEKIPRIVLFLNLKYFHVIIWRRWTQIVPRDRCWHWRYFPNRFNQMSSKKSLIIHRAVLGRNRENVKSTTKSQWMSVSKPKNSVSSSGLVPWFLINQLNRLRTEAIGTRAGSCYVQVSQRKKRLHFKAKLKKKENVLMTLWKCFSWVLYHFNDTCMWRAH